MGKGYVVLTCCHHILSRLARTRRPLRALARLNVISSLIARAVKRVVVLGDFLEYASIGDVVRRNPPFVARIIAIVVHMIIRFVIRKGMCASRFISSLFTVLKFMLGTWYRHDLLGLVNQLVLVC